MSHANAPEICMIWAQSAEGAIGRQGRLPWHIRKDFAHFRKVTLGCPVIMGRKTWESLPHRPLHGRLNIVVSSTLTETPGAQLVRSLEEALHLAAAESLDRIFIIGGSTLYHQTLPRAQRIFVTTVGVTVTDADTYAPELGAEWVLMKEREEQEDLLPLTFAEYVRSTPAASAPLDR